MIKKELGKITDVYFGLGGYQDVMTGLHLTFGGNGWVVNQSICNWDPEQIKHREDCKWTEQDRAQWHDELIRKISLLLKQAKVSSVDKLKNIPVEVEFEGMVMKNWRILTEVL